MLSVTQRIVIRPSGIMKSIIMLFVAINFLPIVNGSHIFIAIKSVGILSVITPSVCMLNVVALLWKHQPTVPRLRTCFPIRPIRGPSDKFIKLFSSSMALQTNKDITTILVKALLIMTLLIILINVKFHCYK